MVAYVCSHSCHKERVYGHSQQDQSAGMLAHQTQMAKGLERVERQLDDLQLDYPGVHAMFAAHKEQAIRDGWLEEAFD